MAKLIEFSGTDGSGKTTALEYMVKTLKDTGARVLTTREVGNPSIPTCVKLREIVLGLNSDLDGAEMEMIFAAMRLRNHRMYRAIDREYDYIVSDRGYLDHLAYTDNNVNDEFTNQLYLNFIGDITRMPDVVVYMDVNTETALKRRVKRGEVMDAIEIKGVEFQERVRSSFIEHLETITMGNNKISVQTVDANQSIIKVQHQINNIVQLITEEYL